MALPDHEKFDEAYLRCISRPQYEPVALLDEFNRRHSVLISCGITPIYVFDGSRHPMKIWIVARTERDKKLANSEKILKEMYAYAATEPLSEDDRKKVLDSQKELVVPDKKLVEMVVKWLLRTLRVHPSFEMSCTYSHDLTGHPYASAHTAKSTRSEVSCIFLPVKLVWNQRP